MKMNLTIYRYLPLLFLTLSSQSIFTELRRPKSQRSDYYSSFFNATPTCKQEPEDEDDQTNQAQEIIKIFVPTKTFYENNKEKLLSTGTFNDHVVYIPEELHDEKKNILSNLFKNITSGGGDRGGIGVVSGHATTEHNDKNNLSHRRSYRHYIDAGLDIGISTTAAFAAAAANATPLGIATATTYISYKLYQNYIMKTSVMTDEIEPNIPPVQREPYQFPTRLIFVPAPEQEWKTLNTPPTLIESLPRVIIHRLIPPKRLNLNILTSSANNKSIDQQKIEIAWILGKEEADVSGKETAKTKGNLTPSLVGVAIGVGAELSVGGNLITTVGGATIVCPVVVVPVVIGTVVVGYVIAQSVRAVRDLIHCRKQKKQNKARENDSNRSDNSGPNKGPEKNPKNNIPGGKAAACGAVANKKMRYTGSPKHTPNSKGDASKPPHDGDKVLQESVVVKTKGCRNLETRVGVENGKVVKFHEHSPGEYHGYIVEEKLDIYSENALKGAGLMNKSGKIIK